MIQVTGYLIKREIGAGGMATVYLAEQSSLEREVALKVMNPQLATDPNFALRFLQEARTLASLAHPHIVAVYDVGTTESGLHYFSMQYLPNGDMAGRIKNQLQESELLPILTGVARALRYAHQRGIVHRDVSPVNVLFDLSGMPILTDFGIARAATRGSRLTSAGVSVGTSHYMSPEQARGGEVDARSDIYSLGATIHEALTGHPPYEGEDGFAIAYAHVFEAIPRLPAQFGHWQPLLDKALAKDPRERYQNMDEFLVALADLGGTTANIPKSVLPVETAATAAMPAPVTGPHPADDASTIVGQTLPQAAAAAAAPDATAVAKAPASKPAAPASAASKYVQKPPSRVVPLVLIGFGVMVLLAAGFAYWRQRANQPLQADASAVAAAGQVASSKNPPKAPQPANPATPAPTPNPAPDAAEPTEPQPDTATTAEPAPQVPALGEELPTVDPQAEQALMKMALATTVVDPLKEALRVAQNAVSKQRYSGPPNPNAFDQYKLALKLDPKNDKAKQGIVDVAKALFESGEKSLAQNKVDEALELYKRADEVARSLPEGQAVALQIAQRRAALRDESLAAGRKAILAWDKALAVSSFERALKFEPGNAEAQKGLKTAERVGEPGFVFRDPISASDGPEMVVMTVAGKKLAVARTETTLGDFRRYWSARGAKTRGANRPSCRDRESFFRTSKQRNFQNPFDKPELAQDAEHPAVCVAWDDAADFAKWLSAETGKRYRLPTAAEFSALAQGARPAACKANLADQRYDKVLGEKEGASCDDGYAATARVKSYEPDSGQLYDIAGNVREWVSDCAGACKTHLALGAAWLTVPGKGDGVPRESFDADLGLTTVGFRVVREVE